MKDKTRSGITVLLIENNKLSVEVITPMIIQADYKPDEILVIDNLESAARFLKEISTDLPKLIILDLGVPKNDRSLSKNVEDDEMIRGGLSFLRKLTRQYGTKISIIVHSSFPTSAVVYQVVSQGVSFVAKHDYDKEFFVQTIKNAQKGHVVISSSAIPLLKQMFYTALRNIILNQEETDILKYLMEGLTDREIGNKMSYGEDWVANRLKKLFKKYGFNKREELAGWYRDYVGPLYQPVDEE